VTDRKETPTGLRAVLNEHPVMATALTAAIVGGAILGFMFLSPDWSAGRRILAGAIGGAGFAFLVSARNVLG
jgi:hypothetical protein